MHSKVQKYTENGRETETNIEDYCREVYRLRSSMLVSGRKHFFLVFKYYSHSTNNRISETKHFVSLYL